MLITREGDLKPPYPRAKLLAEEEASLTLKLSIDERGRVVAVEPVGRADPVFLAAAREAFAGALALPAGDQPTGAPSLRP